MNCKIIFITILSITFFGAHVQATSEGAAVAACKASANSVMSQLNCQCGCTITENVNGINSYTHQGDVTETINQMINLDQVCDPDDMNEVPGGFCQFDSDSRSVQLPPANTKTTGVCKANSTVNMDTLSVDEDAPIVGVPFSLNYSSDRSRAASVFLPQSLGLGGWTPSVVHFYDAVNHVIYYGDGDLYVVTAQSITGGGYYATDENGTEVYYFNNSGVHTQTKDALTGVVKYNISYNMDGTLAAITDQFSNATTFTSSSGNVLITSPYGQVTTLTFDSAGLLASITNPNGEAYTITNDSNGFLSTFVQPLGQTATMNYDSSGYLTSDNSSAGNGLNLTYTFNASTQTQVTTSTDAMGNSVQFTAVASGTGATHSTSDFVGMTTSYSDTTNVSHASTDRYGNSYSVTYATDPRFGSMVLVPGSTSYTVPSSSISASTTLTQSTTLSTATDPFSFTTLTKSLKLQNDVTRIYTSVYNKTAGTVTMTTPQSRTVTKTLNTNGQASAIQAGSLTAFNFSYDTHGRVSGVSQGTRSGSVTYDSHSNVATSTDALGRTTSYSYDSANRLTQETLPDGKVVAMTYDANGRMTSITPPGRTAHTLMYNNYNWLQEYLPPTIPTSSTLQTTFSYYPNGQLYTVNFPAGYIQYNIDYGTERVTSFDSSAGTYSMTYYTNSDLVNTLTAPSGEVLTYSYAGNIPSSIVASGTIASALQFSFNTDGTVASIAVGPSTSSLSSISLSYDKDGVLNQAGDESLTLNTVGAISGSTLNNISEALTFDSFGAAATDTFTASGTTSLASTTYTRDSLGRVSEAASTFGSTSTDRTFQYDRQGRLSRVLESGSLIRSYHYDGNGNRVKLWDAVAATATTATFNAQDQMLTYGNDAYTYDDNGNLSQKVTTTGSTTATTTYSYDIFGNLNSVTLPSGTVITYVIDGQNRRIGKKVNGTLVQGFIYQSQTQIAAELDGSGNVVKQFIYGSKSNIPDYMIYSGNKYRIISDQAGTPKMIVNASTGVMLEQPTYDEFGVPAQTSSVIPFGFAGGIMDYDVGLVRMGARDFSYTIGRFVSKDALLFGGGSTNLYSYVVNDPVNLIDPSGRCPWCIGAVVGGIASGVATYIVNPNASAGTIAAAVAIGAVSGAASSGISATASLGLIFGANAGIGATANVATQLANGSSLNGLNQSSILVSAIAGGIGGVAGLGAGTAAFYGTPVIGNAVGVGAARTAGMCAGAVSGTAVGVGLGLGIGQ